MQLILGDCLEKMKDIPDGSVDMVLTDPPYGTTACKWDSVINLPLMWEQLKRIIKPNGAIVMTASQPFTSALVMSNPDMFKYQMTWIKDRPSNPALAKKRPLNYTEDVLVFYKEFGIFNPQYGKREEKNKRNNANEKFSTESSAKLGDSYNKTGLNDFLYPKNYLKINVQRGLHPTQKPVALMEYLIKTYTNEGETVLDFTMGSGTTGVACKNLNRDFIGIEKDQHYFDIAKVRIKAVRNYEAC
jgi:site-specific DNA-methyltransferase (adenine-specific)